MRFPPCLFLLPAVAFLAACGARSASSTDSNTSNTRLPPEKRLGSLGAGWDVEKEEWKGDCATGEIGFEGIQEASVKFDKAMSEKEMASSLGFSLDARARYGVYEGDLAANFARDTASSAYSESATYSAVYKFKNAKLRNGTLSGRGKTAWERGPDAFKTTCGHEYVDQLALGARFFVNIKMEFSSKSEKQSFSANIGLRGPAFNVRAKLQQASQSMGRSASVSIRLYQQGGNISRITKALSGLDVPVDLNDESKTASAVVVCSMDRLDACLKVIDGAVKYATDTTQDDSFPNQINFQNLDLSSSSGPAILGYITAPWTDLAVYPPDPFTEASVKTARKDLFTAFEKQLGYRNRLDAVLNGPIRLSPDQNSAFGERKKTIEENIERVIEAGKTCYVNISSCTAAAKSALSENNPNYLDEEFDVVPKTFAQWCDVSRLPVHRISMKKTVDELSSIAKVDLSSLGTDPCGVAGQALVTLKSVDLSGKGLTSIEPIVSLPKVAWLSLKGNSFEDAAPLAKMTSLSYLDISFNNILDVKPLAALPNLRTLRAHGNLIDDSAPVRKLFAPVSQLFLNADDVCAFSRTQSLELGAISQEEFTAYTNMNWAPEYATAGKPGSGITAWGECSLAFPQLL